MKEFLQYDNVRNDALLLAHKIYQKDGFVPDIIYTSLRGGAYMANVISEYYKVALKTTSPFFMPQLLQEVTAMFTSTSQ